MYIIKSKKKVFQGFLNEIGITWLREFNKECKVQQYYEPLADVLKFLLLDHSQD